VKARLLPWGAALLVPLLLALANDVLFPVRALLSHLPAFCWLAVMAAGAWGQGRLLLRWLSTREAREERAPDLSLVLSLGLGLGALSLEAFALGALGLFTPRALAGLLLIAAAIAAALPAALRRGAAPFAAPLPAPAAQARLPLAAAGVAALLLLPFVLVPNRAFDALTYHLEVPARFLEAGRLVHLPENLYASAPLLSEMLYGVALGVGGGGEAWAGTDLAGLTSYLFFLLTLALVWSWGRRAVGEGGAAWAVALLAAAPVCMMEVPACGSDWAVTFFTLATVFLLAGGGRTAPLAGEGDGFARSARARDALLPGVLAGLAAGCKHPALGLAILTPLLALAVLGLAGKRRFSLPFAGLFLAAALATAFPWYLKNWLFTGDPLYPLFTDLFAREGGASIFTSPLLASSSWDRLWRWALVPWRAVFDPVAHNMSATVGVLPLALAPLLFAGPAGRDRGVEDPEGRAARALPFLAVWAGVSFLAWSLTYSVLRYAFCVLAVALLFLGVALHRALAGAGRSARAALTGAVLLALAADLGTYLALEQYVNGSLGAALGTQSPGRFLRENYPPFAAIDYLNRMEPPPGKVLFAGEMRGFYARFPRTVPSNDMPNPLFTAVRRGLSPRQVREALAREGFTHLLVNQREWERMAGTSAPGWALPAEARSALAAFLGAETEERFASGGVSVREIRR
jgi:hypothetical protein